MALKIRINKDPTTEHEISCYAINRNYCLKEENQNVDISTFSALIKKGTPANNLFCNQRLQPISYIEIFENNNLIYESSYWTLAIPLGKQNGGYQEGFSNQTL